MCIEREGSQWRSVSTDGTHLECDFSGAITTIGRFNAPGSIVQGILETRIAAAHLSLDPKIFQAETSTGGAAACDQGTPPPVIEMALRKILTTDPTITQTNVAAAIEADTSVQEAWSSLPNYPTNKAQRL